MLNNHLYLDFLRISAIREHRNKILTFCGYSYFINFLQEDCLNKLLLDLA